MEKSKKTVRVHFMGIGGSGISSVARIAKESGFEVTGCDLEEGPNTVRLKREGIPVSLGHDVAHLKDIDILAHTPAVFYQSTQHPEFANAKNAMIWEEFMAKYLQKDKFVIAVAGTHGKGTTSAMLCWVLEQAGLDPTCEVGANLLDWGKKNDRFGRSQYFVCEADEFREKFLIYKPNLAIITSIEMDHPDYFRDFNHVLSSFKKFAAKAQIVIANADLKKYKLAKKVIYYKPAKIKLKLPGEHIRSDAGAVWAAAKALGVKDVAIKAALESFNGLERRFEYRGKVSGAPIYDDYAHHPTAVTANIQAARELYPKKKIWVVFQPHMYSRLESLFFEFAEALKRADRVIVTDVFTRREQGVTKPSGKDLALAVGAPRATYVGGELVNVANFVERNIGPGDVVLALGAGDIYRVSDLLIHGTQK
jgi:UDP-N-acetylmuramate--alanine ligase